jgi:hypothetical protein
VSRELRPEPDTAQILTGVVVEMPTARRRTMVKRAATGPAELRIALISLWSRVDNNLKHQLARILLEELDERALADFFQTVVDEGATSELTAVLRGLC